MPGVCPRCIARDHIAQENPPLDPSQVSLAQRKAQSLKEKKKLKKQRAKQRKAGVAVELKRVAADDDGACFSSDWKP